LNFGTGCPYHAPRVDVITIKHLEKLEYSHLKLQYVEEKLFYNKF